MANMVAIPQLNSGRYKLLKLLGQDTYPSAYLASDTLQGRECVIKELDHDCDQVLQREFATIRRLRHPNLAEYYDLLHENNKAYLVQAVAPGERFNHWAAQDRSVVRILQAAGGVLRALHYLHVQGVFAPIHSRFIQVDNGFIGELPAVRLIHFSLPLAHRSHDVTSTLAYTAPEILAGEDPIAASDLYSFGVLLYEALSGHLPDMTLIHQGQPVLVTDTLQDTILVNLLQALLHPSPKCRPSVTVCWETLERISHKPLRITVEEFRKHYLPFPPFVGREEPLRRTDELLTRVKSGGSIALHLTGFGKSTMAEEICFRGKLLGLQLITPEQLFAQIPWPSSTAETQHLNLWIARLVDTVIDQAKSTPIIINLDHCSPNEVIATGFFKSMTSLVNTGEASGCFLIWTHDLPEGIVHSNETLVLNPLSPIQVVEMIDRMLYAFDTPRWLDSISSLTGGDPALVVDIVRAQIEAGLPDNLAVPANRAGLAEHRFASLSSLEKQLLATIAHSRTPIPCSILRQVIPDAFETLSILINKQLLSLSNSKVAPANIFLRYAAQTEITGNALVELHQRFCEAWQTENQPDVLALGHHLIGAGKVREGVQKLLQIPNPPTEELEQALLMLSADDELRERICAYLATLAQAQGNLSQALEIARALAIESPDAGMLLQAELLLNAGHPRPALEILQKFSTPSVNRQILILRAHFQQGDYEAVIQSVATSLTAAAADLFYLTQIEQIAGTSMVYSGQIEEGLRILNSVEKKAREHRFLEILARALNSQGIALQRLGRLTEAQAAYLEALNQAQQTSDWRQSATCTLNLGTLAHRRLELEQAFTYYRKAAQWAKRSGLGITWATALSNEAELLLLCGEVNQAQSNLQHAEQIAKQSGASAEIGYIYLYQAELNLIRNQLDQAEQCLSLAKEHVASSDSEGITILGVLDIELAFRRPRHSTTRQSPQNLLKQLAENNPERWRAHLLSGKIALNAEPPQIQHALLDLEIALALSHSVGASDRLWEIHALLAYGYHRQGRENEAGFHAGQFQRTLEELRSKIPIPYRTMFEQRPDIHDAQQKVESILSPNLDATPSLVEFKRLLEFNQDLTRFLPVEQLLHRILERALDLTGAERGFVILHQGEELKVLAECNVVPDLTKAELASFSHSIAHSVIKENRSVLAMDAMEDTRFRERLSLAHLSVRAVISVPLRMKNQIWGVLYLDHRFKAQVFQQKHIQLLELFAEQAGIALHNAQLFEEETSKNQTLTQARAQTENRNQELAEQVAQQSEVINSIHIRLRSYEEELIRQYQEAKIIGRSPPMINLYDQINRVAESELPIFIWGESGTGKELIARAIHYTSSRKKHPFVAINCAAIPHPLLESELFGHARGAFTGAHRPRPGLFEVAGYGTLFLDEIGEMPFEMQSKLLRVLQESTFRRLGEESERQCYCRVISASNQHLDGLVTQKKFRQDLYYRLNVLQLRLPALRERSEDIPLLAEYFLAQSPKHAVLTPEAMAALLVYDWPGNIRQLENEIQRAAFLGEGVISLNVLTIPTAQQPSFQPSPAESPHINLEDAVSRFERQLINTALANAKNKVSLAAERLGMHRTALYKKMRQLGISSSRSKPKIKR